MYGVPPLDRASGRTRRGHRTSDLRVGEGTRRERRVEGGMDLHPGTGRQLGAGNRSPDRASA